MQIFRYMLGAGIQPDVIAYTTAIKVKFFFLCWFGGCKMVVPMSLGSNGISSSHNNGMEGVLWMQDPLGVCVT